MEKFPGTPRNELLVDALTVLESDMVALKRPWLSGGKQALAGPPKRKDEFNGYMDSRSLIKNPEQHTHHQIKRGSCPQQTLGITKTRWMDEVTRLLCDLMISIGSQTLTNFTKKTDDTIPKRRWIEQRSMQNR